MIPTADDVIEGHAFLARRFGLDPSQFDPLAIRAAIEHAQELVSTRDDEPAADFDAVRIWFAARLTP